MIIFPAIDLYDGKAVRLFKGDYNQMQIYSNDPVSVAKQFEAAGATVCVIDVLDNDYFVGDLADKQALEAWKRKH